MIWSIDDEHGTGISSGHATEEAAETAASRWEEAHPGRRAYVYPEVTSADYDDEAPSCLTGRGTRVS